MMAMNWPKHVFDYYLEYKFFLYPVVLLTTFNIYKNKEVCWTLYKADYF